MDARIFLKQLKKLDKMIENKLIEKEQWEAIATSSTSGGQSVWVEGKKKELHNMEKVQSSGNPDKMAVAVANYIDIEKEIDNIIADLICKKQDIIGVIEQLSATEYDVLHKMYVGIPKKIKVSSKEFKTITVYQTLEDVAALYDKSKSWSKSVHNNAVRNVQKILDEREKKTETAQNCPFLS